MSYSTIMEYLEQSLDYSLQAAMHRRQRKRLFRFDQKATPARLLARDAHFYAANHLEHVAAVAWICLCSCGAPDALEDEPNDADPGDEAEVAADALVEVYVRRAEDIAAGYLNGGFVA